ncbi:hypothetical protein PENARI_c002G09584 [Penicillium arizonense]|uniref:Uncharacterized protein n=1 Tax=Penicillium arizonense TaxID=1835702 RepID=A0A1F5LVJ7_PENAI|nr:hypothetical protein PENARI_c002G09584 [Penicillium arizonense]OGE57173.1 hypothetical protein PENARI_c002G09584 [Penicillium arizonense]
MLIVACVQPFDSPLAAYHCLQESRESYSMVLGSGLQNVMYGSSAPQREGIKSKLASCCAPTDAPEIVIDRVIKECNTFLENVAKSIRFEDAEMFCY